MPSINSTKSFKNKENLTKECISRDDFYLRERTGGDENAVLRAVLANLYSKIWITYRKDFPPILDSTYTSDAGWGCMLRTTQMMCAQALIDYYFGYGWTLPNRPNAIYTQILSYFNDRPLESCPLSIHNMMSHGKCFKKSVGTWFGPRETCFMISRCIDNSLLSHKLTAILASDHTLYKSEIIKKCCDSQGAWKKSAVIFIPLRLGLDALNSHYVSSFWRFRVFSIISSTIRRFLVFWNVFTFPIP